MSAFLKRFTGSFVYFKGRVTDKGRLRRRDEKGRKEKESK